MADYPIEGPTPLTDQSKNLIRDGTFSEVDGAKRNIADRIDWQCALYSQVAYHDTVHHWSDVWDVTGDGASRAQNSIELLGNMWFGRADTNRGITPYPVSWPTDGRGYRIPYAMNINGVAHYGELGQKISLNRRGTVNVNFLAVRNNYSNCGLRDGTYEVELKPVSGGSGLIQSVTDKGKGAGYQGPDGHWVRHSLDFRIDNTGDYWLIIKGVVSDPIGATCGSFVADVYLGYRTTPVLLDVDTVLGGRPYKLTTGAGQYFKGFKLRIGDGSPDQKPLADLPVKFEITRSGAGITFNNPHNNQRTVEIWKTNANGEVSVPMHYIHAGATAGRQETLKISADGTPLLEVILSIEVPKPVYGLAYRVHTEASTYLSGERQNAPSQKRFARALSVVVSDKDGHPATSGEVTFTVASSPAADHAYLSISPDADWTSVASAHHTSLDVRVANGRARVWLWGEHTAADGATELTVRAQVKGGHPEAVTYLERVWRSATALSIKKFGDNQNIHYGHPPSSMKVQLVQTGKPASVIVGEWMHWKIETSDLLRFRTRSNDETFVWESAQSAWTRTDADGFALAPPIETLGNHGSKTGRLIVSSPIGQQATFTLHVSEVELEADYSFDWEDEDPLPVDVETPRTVRVLDKHGQGVAGVEVHAKIEQVGNTANITVSPTAATSKSAPENDKGRVTFELTAADAGVATLMLTGSKVQTKRTTLLAQPGTTRKHLKFVEGDRLDLDPSALSAVNPVIVFVDPPDLSIAELRFQISPSDSHGQLRAKVNGHWRLEGSIPIQADGRFYIEQLKFVDPPLDSEDARQYKLRFDVPRRRSIHAAEFTVNAASAAQVDLRPETAETPYILDTNSTVEHDPKVFALTYRMVQGGRVVAPNVNLTFVVTLIDPPHADPSEVSFVGSGTGRITATTDQNGKVELPALRIRNWVGSFEVSVYTGGGSSPAGKWHFRTRQPPDPAVLVFNAERSRLKAVHTYEESDPADSVTVYSDTAKKKPVRSGTVTFSISGGNPCGASFQGADGRFPDGAPITTKASTIKSDGTAPVPTLRIATTGTLTLVATISNIDSVARTIPVV